MCEKLFRETRIRTSTEHIGLARHAEELELVRIGKPLRPEFAAWRYGDQFGRRRRRSVVRWSAAGCRAGRGCGGRRRGRGLGRRASGPEQRELRHGLQQLPAHRRLSNERRTHHVDEPECAAGLRLTAVGEGRELCVDAVARHVLVKRREQFLGEDALRVLSVALPPINAWAARAAPCSPPSQRSSRAGGRTASSASW